MDPHTDTRHRGKRLHSARHAADTGLITFRSHADPPSQSAVPDKYQEPCPDVPHTCATTLGVPHHLNPPCTASAAQPPAAGTRQAPAAQTRHSHATPAATKSAWMKPQPLHLSPPSLTAVRSPAAQRGWPRCPAADRTQFPAAQSAIGQRRYIRSLADGAWASPGARDRGFSGT